MAVLYACDEFDTFATFALVDRLGKVLVQVVDEYTRIFCLQVATIVRNNLTIFEGYDITANGKIIVSHFVTNRGCFQWSATLIHLI